jgi:hypothetical protein
MKQPDDVRRRLETAWARNWTTWLGGGGAWPLTVSLDPPTESKARQHWTHFQAWVRIWNAPEWAGRVEFVSRAWRSLGVQEVPSAVRFEGPDAVAATLGPSKQLQWAASAARWSERVKAWPDLGDELRAIADQLGTFSDGDYQRFITAFEWLASHPDSGLYVRQLPIAGLDSKWVEAHAGPIARLLARRLQRPQGLLAQVAGLAFQSSRRRMRLLDPELRARMGGLSDIQAPLEQLARLVLPVRVAIVVENQQTALACGDIPGAVLLMGGGFAVTELGRIPWLERVPIVYWGDIDTAGLAILNALRSWHPHTVACMMDQETLLCHSDLWSREDVPTLGVLNHLTAEEAELHRLLVSGELWGPGMRLEQERLEWTRAWVQLCDAVERESSSYAMRFS